jgi:hypothetical protein
MNPDPELNITLLDNSKFQKETVVREDVGMYSPSFLSLYLLSPSPYPLSTKIYNEITTSSRKKLSFVKMLVCIPYLLSLSLLSLLSTLFLSPSFLLSSPLSSIVDQVSSLLYFPLLSFTLLYSP